MEVTRFAPSPTGWLHLGHAFAALFAAARSSQNSFLVRLEDLDSTRSRPEYETGLMEDLSWLGLSWPRPMLKQSTQMQRYQQALGTLEARGLLYPCFCTRKEIQEEWAQMTQAPQGPDGPLYPGRCRSMPPEEASHRMQAGESFALRLHSERAIHQAGGPLTWIDRQKGPQIALPQIFGDVVLARKDIAASYHLAVVLDDAFQGVTLVTRGEDLFPSTHLHRLLLALLDLPVPEWEHHRLICDEKGQRLAKRDAARSLRQMRAEGYTAEKIRQLLGF